MTVRKTSKGNSKAAFEQVLLAIASRLTFETYDAVRRFTGNPKVFLHGMMSIGAKLFRDSSSYLQNPQIDRPDDLALLARTPVCVPNDSAVHSLASDLQICGEFSTLYWSLFDQ